MSEQSTPKDKKLDKVSDTELEKLSGGVGGGDMGVGDMGIIGDDMRLKAGGGKQKDKKKAKKKHK
ncbi:hypothetical protein Lqui_2654 [Legionella quinlivanii]|uniref:Uncharacterized protein n=1 Tax=Legionella quinlivanii TaxID=45073 RepID=A0A0W0XKV5_9GAMM|nr:hypothetical protein [Legionella quinlivanii]KTD45183.1 hypothetical protein Lqui_2654 [Legionella quinlivanii]MCW8450306.1 hypothetical protein [Legionella quinlivanii]SEG05866.1 hypothetical protein SAMN02746093_01773 [Legionella quinlivanii DSM 21216]STY11520.1 Uncharacterised protein [Legionella quinlivanii]